MLLHYTFPSKSGRHLSSILWRHLTKYLKQYGVILLTASKIQNGSNSDT